MVLCLGHQAPTLRHGCIQLHRSRDASSSAGRLAQEPFADSGPEAYLYVMLHLTRMNVGLAADPPSTNLPQAFDVVAPVALMSGGSPLNTRPRHRTS